MISEVKSNDLRDSGSKGFKGSTKLIGS